MATISFITYQTIRVEGRYDPSEHSKDSAIKEAMSMLVAEAASNAQYNGETNGVEVTCVALR